MQVTSLSFQGLQFPGSQATAKPVFAIPNISARSLSIVSNLMDPIYTCGKDLPP
jgi:hypothetical protein